MSSNPKLQQQVSTRPPSWSSDETPCDGESVVVTPCDGLYTFFFHASSHTQEMSDHRHQLGDANKTTTENICTLVVTTNIQGEAKRRTTTTQTPLPLRHEGEALIDRSVGMVLWFGKNTSLVVEQRRRLPGPIASTPDDCYFRLVLRRSRRVVNDNNHKKQKVLNKEVEEDRSTAAKTTTSSSSTAQKQVTPNKPLVCGTCLRAFANWSALDSHCTFAQHPRRSTRTLTDIIYHTPLKVIYQDDAMAVIIKPQGMVVQGASPSLLRSSLLAECLSTPTATTTNSDDCLRKPRPVHRLDAATGGLLVIAKTYTAEAILKDCFANRTCRKRYRAVVVGHVPNASGTIEESVQGKAAETRYQVVQHLLQAATVVDLWPLTGRYHQLRRHMQWLGHSIVGDPRYGRRHTAAVTTTGEQTPKWQTRLALFAMEIELPHPVTQKVMKFTMETPEWLDFVVSELQKEGDGQQTYGEDVKAVETKNDNLSSPGSNID